VWAKIKNKNKKIKEGRKKERKKREVTKTYYDFRTPVTVQ
jgi:hypothetical protein